MNSASLPLQRCRPFRPLLACSSPCRRRLDRGWPRHCHLARSGEPCCHVLFTGGSVLFFPCFLRRIVFFVIVSSFCSSFVGRSPSTGSRRRSLRSNNLRNQITRTRILLTRSTAATCNLLHIHGLQLLGVMYISMQRMRSSSS